ncbi:MAG: hypothetical protein EAZ41_01315, partial [Sphingobacteriia bacterium]
MNFVIKLAVYVAVVFGIDYLLVGITFRTIEAGLLVAGCMALINMFIKPIVKTLAFPLTLMTLGIFPLILNTVFVLIVANFVKDFTIVGDVFFRFFWAFAFGFLLTVATMIIEQ